MTLVVDASLWALQSQPGDPREAVARGVIPKLVGKMPVCAPILIGYELSHLFFAKKIDPKEHVSFRLRRVGNMLADVRLVESDWDRIGYVADRFGLTGYDSAYLELAERLDASLATEDEALRRAGAKALGTKKSLRLADLAKLID